MRAGSLTGRGLSGPRLPIISGTVELPGQQNLSVRARGLHGGAQSGSNVCMPIGSGALFAAMVCLPARDNSFSTAMRARSIHLEYTHKCYSYATSSSQTSH